MQVEFLKNKDGFLQGQIVDIDRSSYQYIYWLKKGCIKPVEAQETSNPVDVPPEQKQGSETPKKANKTKGKKAK